MLGEHESSDELRGQIKKCKGESYTAEGKTQSLVTDKNDSAALFCLSSNIELKIFKKLNFDAFEKKEAQNNNRGLLPASHRGETP